MRTHLLIALLSAVVGLAFVAGLTLFFAGWTGLLVTAFGWFLVLVAFVCANLLTEPEDAREPTVHPWRG